MSQPWCFRCNRWCGTSTAGRMLDGHLRVTVRCQCSLEETIVEGSTLTPSNAVEALYVTDPAARRRYDRRRFGLPLVEPAPEPMDF